MKVLVIAACSRSGCTILENLLGGYDGVFAGGELTNLWQRGAVENRPCGCGEPFRGCAVWDHSLVEAFGELTAERAQQIGAGAKIGTVDVMTRRLPGRQARIDRSIADYATALRALVRGIERSQQPSMIIDAGSPTHIEIYRSMADVDLRILHLVRDVRGVAYSTQRHMMYDPSMQDPIEMERFGPIRSGAMWAAQNIAFELERSRVGDYRRVRYEDFTADPRSFVDDIARWCGLDVGSSPFVSDTRAEPGPNHIVSGNPSRFNSGAVEIIADDEWRDSLSTRDRTLLTAVFAPLLLRYGYPLRSGRS